MSEQAGLSDQYRKASPWPVFIALGLAVGELGILFNLFPVAVGGLLLLCGSIAGMAEESGYASTPWRALSVCAVILLGFGGALLYAEAQTGTQVAQLGERGYAVLAAAVIMLVGAVLGEALGQKDELPI